MMLASAPVSLSMESLTIDLLGHHSVRVFIDINALENFFKMSFFATKIADGISGFAATCMCYFLFHNIYKFRLFSFFLS